MGLKSITEGFRVIGLSLPEVAAHDVSVDQIARKITNPHIARAMGATQSVLAIEHAEWCANLADSFSETGDPVYLQLAETRYQALLDLLAPPARERIMDVAAAVFNYFSFERVVRERIKRDDRFVDAELFEYLLRRGSDSLVYAILLQELDGIPGRGMVAGFRIRQALWDLADDIVDLEQDRQSTGANIMLLAEMNRKRLSTMADDLLDQSVPVLKQNSPLLEAILIEHAKVKNLLAA